MALRTTESHIPHSQFMIIKLEYIMALGIPETGHLLSAAYLNTFHTTTRGGGKNASIYSTFSHSSALREMNRFGESLAAEIALANYLINARWRGDKQVYFYSDGTEGLRALPLSPSTPLEGSVIYHTPDEWRGKARDGMGLGQQTEEDWIRGGTDVPKVSRLQNKYAFSLRVGKTWWFPDSLKQVIRVDKRKGRADTSQTQSIQEYMGISNLCRGIKPGNSTDMQDITNTK